MFLGVSIIADRFMASIEVITSQERRITIKRPNGEKVTTTVRIWNETVSNLTLMALGSSAPEILLSVVEVCGHNFDAGQLGPNTIVGSAAFNMFVIIGLCVYVIPDGDTRRVKHLRVFFVTAAWSVFAYIWLYLILAVFSPGVVKIWEGLLTLAFFPLCVGFAYVADRRLLFYKYVHKRYRAGRRRGVIIETEGEPASQQTVEMDIKMLSSGSQELKKDKPRSDLVQAQNHVTSAGHDCPCRIFFDPPSYQCQENCGTVELRVVRQGRDLTSTITVDYWTEDGTAIAGPDYKFIRGTLVFSPGELEKKISVEIMDDDIFEEDEHFLVHLSGVQVVSEGYDKLDDVGLVPGLGRSCTAIVTIHDDDHSGVFMFEDSTSTVMKNIGMMEVKVVRVGGARSAVVVPYRTLEGTAKGGGKNFEDTIGVLEFENNEICKLIRINLIDDEEYDKNKKFYVELGEPKLVEISRRKALLLQEVGGFIRTANNLYRRVQNRENPDPSTVIYITEEEVEFWRRKAEHEWGIAELGRPCLGENVKMEVVIEESYEFKNVVDKVIKKTNLALLVGTNSWRQQFLDAITVGSGDEDDDDGEEEKVPTATDYVIHSLTVFWKVLFALVPPTDYWSGWACFIVSISVIGILTAVIGDLASHFGCTVGLKDSVTAVVFVALGTSVPDTFASKVAAIQDQYADASIGNVTGSNAVNVFLGIGVAWSIAAVYHYTQNQDFLVDPGTLAFSVTLFTIFAFICIAVLIYRRGPAIGGELGGPRLPKILTTGLFFSLWLMYIVFSSLEAYCHIKGF
ncbi:sodium/calcium exchanger 1-like [Synchiropus picturatus]